MPRLQQGGGIMARGNLGYRSPNEYEEPDDCSTTAHRRFFVRQRPREHDPWRNPEDTVCRIRRGGALVRGSGSTAPGSS